MNRNMNNIAQFHLPGLFEFYDFYKVFLPVFYENRELFYENINISSIYGAPSDCIWSGGRFGYGDDNPQKVLKFVNDYGISARLTFSNSLLKEEHLLDDKCNKLCALFNEADIPNGVIVHSDLLLDYLRKTYPDLYFVSSTTKVLSAFDDFYKELNREEFKYIVPDFRINKQLYRLNTLSKDEKDKVEFLCNECCYIGCDARNLCYENVSNRILNGIEEDFICRAKDSDSGYMFSKAMQNPSFISIDDINRIYLPSGFSNFKIEGRNLGSALIFEILLYYMAKPEYQLRLRELIYLDSMLNLF